LLMLIILLSFCKKISHGLSMAGVGNKKATDRECRG